MACISIRADYWLSLEQQLVGLLSTGIQTFLFVEKGMGIVRHSRWLLFARPRKLPIAQSWTISLGRSLSSASSQFNYVSFLRDELWFDFRKVAFDEVYDFFEWLENDFLHNCPLSNETLKLFGVFPCIYFASACPLPVMHPMYICRSKKEQKSYLFLFSRLLIYRTIYNR